MQMMQMAIFDFLYILTVTVFCAIFYILIYQIVHIIQRFRFLNIPIYGESKRLIIVFLMLLFLISFFAIAMLFIVLHMNMECEWVTENILNVKLDDYRNQIGRFLNDK